MHKKNYYNYFSQLLFTIFIAIYSQQILAVETKALLNVKELLIESNENSGSAKKIPLKVAFVYVGSIGDGGWTFSHEKARKEVEQFFGTEVVASFIENVPENELAEAVFFDLIEKGHKLIFSTSYGHKKALLKIAALNKNISFEHATGDKVSDNLRIYDSRSYEGAYLAGVLAGKMTKTNKIGVVGSIPIPDVIRTINGFTLGAQSVNPNIKTCVAWANTWHHPDKETSAAIDLINNNVDVLMQTTDSSAVLKTAEKYGKYAIGWDSDMSAYSSKAHLGSIVNNWSSYYIESINHYIFSNWDGNRHSSLGIKEGVVDLVSISSDVPSNVKEQVEMIKLKFKMSEFFVFRKKAITSNDDVVAGDSFRFESNMHLSKMDIYVKGVEANLPGSGKKIATCTR
jgi:basic membrane protein A